MSFFWFTKNKMVVNFFKSDLQQKKLEKYSKLSVA